MRDYLGNIPDFCLLKRIFQFSNFHSNRYVSDQRVIPAVVQARVYGLAYISRDTCSLLICRLAPLLPLRYLNFSTGRIKGKSHHLPSAHHSHVEVPKFPLLTAVCFSLFCLFFSWRFITPVTCRLFRSKGKHNLCAQTPVLKVIRVFKTKVMTPPLHQALGLHLVAWLQDTLLMSAPSGLSFSCWSILVSTTRTRQKGVALTTPVGCSQCERSVMSSNAE